jgi:hypothetical protein
MNVGLGNCGRWTGARLRPEPRSRARPAAWPPCLQAYPLTKGQGDDDRSARAFFRSRHRERLGCPLGRWEVPFPRLSWVVPE